MAKFLSDDYLAEVDRALSADAKWVESTKGVRVSVMIVVSDTGQSHVLSVENGVTSISRAVPGAQTEFSFEGTYDSWARVAKGEVDMQSAVLKGQLKFKGSITKLLAYRDRFLRIPEVMKSVPKDF